MIPEPARVLIAHNRYLEPGGEDVAFESEASLLRGCGHQVTEYREDNDRIRSMNRVAVAVGAVWSRRSRTRIARILRERRPLVAHFHNTFPLISPSAYSACRDARVSVVQTVHNYRIACPAATLFRDGGVCERCVGKVVAWPGVVHACYRGSRTQSAIVAGSNLVHGVMGTWRTQVDVWVALTRFARNKLVEAGLPPDRIIIKPNFVERDPGASDRTGEYGLFVGRLSPEKGVWTLLRAWKHLGSLPLKVVGDGPVRGPVRQFLQDHSLASVELLGRRPRPDVLKLMRGARVLIFPSECYENFPMAIVEAFATGLPVIAAAHGAMVEIVEDGRTGGHFTPGSDDDLAGKVEDLWGSEDRLRAMAREARETFETRYSPKSNYEALIRIYNEALTREASSR